MRERLLLCCLLLVANGCLPSSVPPHVQSRSALRGVPLARSTHPVSGRVTYRLISVEPRDGDVVVDIDLTNGSGTVFDSAAVTVIAVGPEGERRGAWVPIGWIASGATERVVARIRQVGFRVSDVELEFFASP